MKSNIKGVFMSVNANGDLIPYCNFERIDQFINYLWKNDLLIDYDHSDFINFLSQIEE